MIGGASPVSRPARNLSSCRWHAAHSVRRSPLHRRPISLPIMACARRCSSWPLGRLMPRGDGWLGRLPPFGRVDFLRISCRCEDLPSSPPRMNTFCRSRPYPPENRSVEARFRSPTYVLNARATSALPGKFLFLSAPHLRDSLMVLSSRACSRSTPRAILSGAVTYMKPGRRQPRGF